MNFNFQPYQQELQSVLRDFIVLLDHIDTGAMYESIEFIITETQDSFEISLFSEYYIVYLDDAQFLNDFFSLAQTQEIIDRLSGDYGIYYLNKLI